MIRVGVVGCGRVGREVHLPLLARHPDVTIAAIADPGAAPLADASRLAPRARSYANWQDLLAAGALDAIVIASPPSTHAPIAIAALDRGLPVYLEKPMTTDAAEARAIVAAWRRSGRTAMVGFNYRFNPLYEAASRAIRAGEIGAMVAVHTVFKTAPIDRATWQRSIETGGGVLPDLASHHLDLIRAWSGREVIRIAATSGAGRTPEAAAILTATLDGGVMVRIEVAHDEPDQDQVEVIGASGRLVADRYRSHRPIVLPAHRTIGGALRDGVRAVAGVGYRARKLRSPWHDPSHGRALATFLAALPSGQVRPDPNDGRVVVDLIEAARRSAGGGVAVDVESA